MLHHLLILTPPPIFYPAKALVPADKMLCRIVSVATAVRRPVVASRCWSIPAEQFQTVLPTVPIFPKTAVVLNASL